MKAKTVKKWGNSAAVRIPASVMQALHLHLDALVDVREDEGRIVIEPIQRKTYDLDAAARHHRKNRHDGVRV